MRAAVLVLTLLFAAMPSQGAHVPGNDIDWACGYGGGHPDDCGIDPVGGDSRVNSVGDPIFAADWPGNGLHAGARVLGIVVNEDARAYPVRMLNTHEIVNDVVGGEKVSITFCPLCGSGVSFLRQVEPYGETNFTASGYLYATDMVMWDPETNQLWNQLSGTPIGWLDDDNPRTADHLETQLDFIPTTITTWGNWQTKHVDTLLLQPVFSASSYREDVYSVTRSDSCQHGLSGENACDVDGLHPKVQVVGHDDGAGGIAFPIHDVAQAGGAVFFASDRAGFVGVGDASGDARIYAAAGQTFTPDESGLWRDANGGLWDLRQGLRLDAPGQLEQLDTAISFWFAWHDHYPETLVWLPEGGSTPPSSDDRGIPTASAAILLPFLLVFTAFTRKRS